MESPEPLSEEIRLMLKEELRKEYRHYFSILEAISIGSNTPKRISEYTGIKMESLSRYLNDLIKEYELVGRVKSFFKRKSLYYIRSNDVNFWARFIWKNIEKVETLEEEDVAREFENEIENYYSIMFERFCMEILEEMGYEKISKEWKEEEYEIDIVARENDKIYFFEVKFSRLSKEEYENVRKSLMEVSELLKINAIPVVISWEGAGDIVVRNYIEENWIK